MARIFVGNLPYTATNDELTGLFSPFGQVDSSAVITDKATGRSKGFAFVEMPDETAANTAIAQLNGKPFNGRDLAVSIARPREERPDRPPRS